MSFQITGQREAAYFVDYEDVLEHVGPFSAYTMRTFLPLCLAHIFAGAASASLSIVGIIPEYRSAHLLNTNA